MCNRWCLDFLSKSRYFVRSDADILEVGSKNVNGTARTILPYKSYWGVDIVEGDGVDELVNVYSLRKRFGTERFDVVVATELLEHVEDWADAVYQLVSVCKIGGYVYITTRSEGFPFHEYPIDAWRFSYDDIINIFSPIGVIVASEKDLTVGSPGVGAVIIRGEIPDDKLTHWRSSLYKDYPLFHVKSEQRKSIQEAYLLRQS